MEITCPRCHSEHEIEPPASARARGPRSLKFRCSHCGHTFSVDPEAPRESTSPPPLGEKPAGESIQLVQVDGQIWSVPDMAALHQWILARRLDRDALVSKHGLRWVRAGEREDLAVFFAASDALSFQQRNLRTELPAHDDEMVVDAPDADGFDSTSVDANAQGRVMPVATGPGPSVGGYPHGLDTAMMDFDGADDTQEQTVHTGGLGTGGLDAGGLDAGGLDTGGLDTGGLDTGGLDTGGLDTGGLDETPIDSVPASFDRGGAAAERTERLPPRRGVRAVPLPMGVSTVTPGPAPAGSAALGIPSQAQGTPVHAAQAPAVLPGPAVTSAPSRVVPLPAKGGPSAGPGLGSAPQGPPPVAPHAGPSAMAAGFAPPPAAAPSASHTFFLEAPTSSATSPRHDVFDDPPPTSSGTNWALRGGVAAMAAVGVLAVAMWMGPGVDTRAPDTRAPDTQAPAHAAATSAPLAAATLPGAGEVPAVPGGGQAPDAADAQATPAVVAPAVVAPAVVAPAVVAAAPAPAVGRSASGAGAGSVKAPAAAVAPAPKADAPRGGTGTGGGSPKKLVEQGWKAVEAGDYTKAHGLFDRALQGGMGADALFGRGYANEKLGDTNSASDDYCRALSGSAVSIDMQREIEAGLRRLGRTCS